MSANLTDWHDELVLLIPRVRRFALTLTGSAHDADDLVQATVEKALVKREQFTPGTNLRGWLFRICRNLWIDEWRGPRGKTDEWDAENADHVQTIDGERVTSGVLELAEVTAAMNTLGDDKREVLALVAVEGYSYKEVSEILDIPVGTVMSRLARARQALADQLSLRNSDESRYGDQSREVN